MNPLPPCGIYRTTVALSPAVEAQQLVYFHNHGDPGPGVYLPSAWVKNRASWHTQGHVLPDSVWAQTLVRLSPEGFYRVEQQFDCCEKRCRTFEPGMLVQLGYNGNAEALLFVPEWRAEGLFIPEQGALLSPGQLPKLSALHVPGLEAGVDTATQRALH